MVAVMGFIPLLEQNLVLALLHWPIPLPVYLVLVDPQVGAHVAPISLDFCWLAVLQLKMRLRCPRSSSLWPDEKFVHQIFEPLNRQRGFALV
jgi:hypothetical protein